MTLHAEDLQVRLGKTRILDQVTLSAESGQVLALLGPNGAGKSTFLRTASGLLRPAQGTIRIDGTDLHRLPPRTRARHIGLVPQEHRIRHPFTVREIVTMGRYAYRGPLQGPRHDDHEQVHRALTTAHVQHLEHRNATTLSGGERQRVMIARVLAQDPDVYLFDEPTASLDLAQAHHVTHLMKHLAQQGKTVIAVLHDLEEASRLADHAVLLSHGRLIAHGHPRDVIAPGPIRQAYEVEAEVIWAKEEAGCRIHVTTQAKSEPQNTP